MTRLRRVSTRQDALTVRVRTRIQAAMDQHKPKRMTQVQLAKKAKVTQQSVQRFLSGQMPYPPMTFLDKLTRVFGWSLVEVIAELTPSRPPIVINDPRVQQIAIWLEAADDRTVEGAYLLIERLQRPRT
jgi:transcriptional regulator with XRE-family HTH domain